MVWVALECRVVYLGHFGVLGQEIDYFEGVLHMALYIGYVNENVNINLEGKDMIIAFNGKFLSEYLRIIKDDFIKFKLNTSIDPCILTPAGKDDFIYLVLPVSINV